MHIIWNWFMFDMFNQGDRGSLLLKRVNLNPSMDKKSYAQKSIGWNYLSLPKLQRQNRWSLEMESHYL